MLVRPGMLRTGRRHACRGYRLRPARWERQACVRVTIPRLRAAVYWAGLMAVLHRLPRAISRLTAARGSAALLLIAALGLFANREAIGQTATARDPLVVAVNTSTIEGAPIYVAAAAPGGGGFTLVNGGVRDLASGRAQLATNAETQMLLASTMNPKIRMLLTVAEGRYRLIARKSAGIRTLADLRGKRITTVPQTSAHYYVVKLLQSAGLQESDVRFVAVDRNDMARAVARGDADGISMWEPEAQRALELLGSDATVFQNNELYREWFSLYTTTDVLADGPRRAQIVEFVRSLVAATSTVQSRTPDVMPIVARTIGQSEASVKGAWAHHAFPAALPPNMLDILIEEERWVAALQKRQPRTRDTLAAFLEPSVLRDAAHR
jgi:ABC-type nitrate/sulfonate/bicarbonate transport system substrate-binding protein